MRFERMLPAELRAARDRGLPFVLPIGAMDYHGEGLPVGADLLAVTGVLDRLGDGAVILPPFAYGAATHAALGPEGTGTLHLDATPVLPLAEAMFSALLAAGFRNIHGVLHHETESFAQGMPTDAAFRHAARNAVLNHQRAEMGTGWLPRRDMADPASGQAGAAEGHDWIRIHTLFPRGAVMVPGRVGAIEAALIRALEPGIAVPETAPPDAATDAGARGIEIALSHLRGCLGLPAR